MRAFIEIGAFVLVVFVIGADAVRLRLREKNTTDGGDTNDEQ